MKLAIDPIIGGDGKSIVPLVGAAKFPQRAEKVYFGKYRLYLSLHSLIFNAIVVTSGHLILFFKICIFKQSFHEHYQCVKMFRIRSGLEVIKLVFILKLKIKRNDWLLADTCPKTANHCAYFELEKAKAINR